MFHCRVRNMCSKKDRSPVHKSIFFAHERFSSRKMSPCISSLKVQSPSESVWGWQQHADWQCCASGQSLGCGDLVEVPHLCLPRWDLLGGHVSTCVLGEMVAAHKSSFTHRTDKLLLACVCSPMPRELIRACKFLIAAFPIAAERFLSCMGSEMCLQVRTFKISFPTAWEIADIVAPAGKVDLCGAALPWGHVNRSGSQRQELGVA